MGEYLDKDGLGQVWQKIKPINVKATAAEAAAMENATLLANLAARVDRLNLKYGTEITGNAFEVTFDDLTGLIATGVYNQARQRIEF